MIAYFVFLSVTNFTKHSTPPPQAHSCCSKWQNFIPVYGWVLLHIHTWKCEIFSRSVVSDSLWPPWTVAHHAPLFMGFPRQEYWSRLPFPSWGDLPDPGIEPGSPFLKKVSYIYYLSIIHLYTYSQLPIAYSCLLFCISMIHIWSLLQNVHAHTKMYILPLTNGIFYIYLLTIILPHSTNTSPR